MTNTIPNVPRELKPCPFCGGEPNLTTADYVHDDLTPMPVVECKSCSAWVQADEWNARAPSPAGVDGLEVIGWYTDDHLDDKSATTYSREVADRWLAKGWPVNGIANAAAAQAIIDGLRGENEALQAQVKVLQSDANSWQSGYDEGRRMGGKHCALTIDQQAQRIGELEGLLLRVQVSLSLDDTEWGYSGAEKYKLLADIRAAMSAGKEG